MKVTHETKLSVYLRVKCCTSCSWFAKPNVISNREVCPDCGESLELQTGRYQYTETTRARWLEPIANCLIPLPSSTSIVYDKFIPKETREK